MEAALVTDSTAVKSAVHVAPVMELTTSAIQSIVDMLEKKRDSGVTSDTSNVSVRHALLTNRAEAKRVIEKELQQMLDKRVWTPVPSSALCLRPIVVLRFFIFFDISQNMIIFARFKSSSEAQLNFLRESSTLGYMRHYDLNRSCN